MLKRRKPIKRVSDKRKREYPLYMAAREKFLKERPVCEVCKAGQATQVHHKKHRGKYYLDVSTWCSCCDICHRQIHHNPEWAYSCGYLERR
jgi:hypothetical protein